jgi:hypothetical protein
MIDVVPIAPGRWLARCECDATAEFPDAAAGWAWVLGHPCDDAGPAVVDLTETGVCAVE